MVRKVVWAINKCDLTSGTGADGGAWAREGEPVVKVSAVTGAGLKELEELLSRALLEGEVMSVSPTVTSERHFNVLQGALVSLGRARESLEQGLSNEFIALDVREAALRLGEITGEITSEDILNSIFERTWGIRGGKRPTSVGWRR